MHGARSCTHCKAELLTVRCPQCFALQHTGGSVCGHCAATLGLEAHVGPMGIRCPRCLDTELCGVRLDAHDLGECTGCGGLFVEHEVLERATRAADGRRGVRLRAVTASKTAAPAAPKTDASFYLPCPRCASTMNRKNFGRFSGVVVDVCQKHGVWLDRNEIERVIEFVESGGLERAREPGYAPKAPRAVHLDDRRPRAEDLEGYDMVGSFFRSLLSEIGRAALGGRRRGRF